MGALPGERVRVDLYRTRWKRWGSSCGVSHTIASRRPAARASAPAARSSTTPEEEDRYKALVIEEVFARELRARGPAVRCVAPARRGPPLARLVRL